jgi:predicted signal transduction protein with EAL and GGDEF domain
MCARQNLYVPHKTSTFCHSKVKTSTRLDSLGCDAYQGYHFAEPAPPERVVEMMSKRGQVFVPAG